jgi:hypothetical protein
MSKIRTTEQFIDFISNDISWRIKELAIIYSIVRTSPANTLKSSTMIRSGVTVLYAHWEGFIKSASTAYLEFISRQDLSYKDLIICFRAISIREKIKIASFANTLKSEVLLEATDFLLNHQEDKCYLKWDKLINTQSNLNSSVLKEIIFSIGLDYTQFATKEKLIDNVLLHYRNNIAHGRGFYPSIEEFSDLYNEILILITIFRNNIENAAILENYKVK